MKDEPSVDEVVMAAPSEFKDAAVHVVRAMVRRWDWAMVVALALLRLGATPLGSHRPPL